MRELAIFTVALALGWLIARYEHRSTWHSFRESLRRELEYRKLLFEAGAKVDEHERQAACDQKTILHNEREIAILKEHNQRLELENDADGEGWKNR